MPGSTVLTSRWEICSITPATIARTRSRRAPAPGGGIIFNAGWLTGVAQAHGLSWHPPTPFTSIRVERAATEVGGRDVSNQIAISLGLADQPDHAIILDNTIKIFAPTGSAPRIGVENLDFNKDTNRFTAEIRVPADDASVDPVRVSGRVQAMVAMVVPSRTLEPGNIVALSDLSTAWFRVELAPAGGCDEPG